MPCAASSSGCPTIFCFAKEGIMKGLPTVTYGNLPVYLGVVFALINGAMVGLGGARGW